MNKKNKIVLWVALALFAFALAGCAQVLETASDRFDEMMGNVLSTGQDSYSDNGTVSIRVLTATPSPGPTLSPTPTMTPTPTPTPANVEPPGERVDEIVYATSTVNIRAKWNSNSLIVGGLYENDQIHRVAILENGWSKVSYNSEYAYVRSDFLTTERPKVPGILHLDTSKYAYDAVLNNEDVILLGVKNILQKPDLPA